MKKEKRCTTRSLLVLYCICVIVLSNGCKKEYEQAKELELEKTEVIIGSDSTVSIAIMNGNGDYKVSSSNVEIASANINQNSIIIKAASNIVNAETIVTVTDQYYKRSNIYVHVLRQANLLLSKDSIVLSQQQGVDSFYIHNGSGNYTISISNPLVAKAIVHDSIVEVIGKKNGIATIVINDQLGRTRDIPIKVVGADYAFDFGTSYFGWADFKSIAQVDGSVKQEKQVTFELTCKLSGYRGLQTFMGLENNLIIRGKNDGFNQVHPIEIAGLHDSIMLLSTSSFNLNQWMNIALVVDCQQSDISNKYKLYINGKQDLLVVERNTGSHNVVNLTYSGDNSLFEIGRAAGQDFRAIQGVVSEARVWTVARSASQITNNMCALTESNPSGLLAYWKFSAGNATNYIQDVSGGKYETNLILANVSGGGYGQVMAPASKFVTRACPNQ